MKAARTLIIVAAEQDLRLFRSLGPGEPLTEINHLAAETLPDVEVELEGRGRGHAGGGGGSHGYDDRKTEAEQERARFVPYVAETVAAVWRKGEHDRAVLIAGPKMLGLLRDGLTDDVKAAIVADLPKDLVKLNAHDLADHLKGLANL
jgi:protein required for attachment to host cells